MRVLIVVGMASFLVLALLAMVTILPMIGDKPSGNTTSKAAIEREIEYQDGAIPFERGN